MKNWRTTLGGALNNFGKALMGAGVLLQFTDAPPESKRILWYTAFVGAVITCTAGFVTSLFTADAKTVKEVSEQTNLNKAQIEDTKSKVETSFITKGS